MTDDPRGFQLSQTASEPVDLVIIGGGINGTGALADAAARGLRTVLLERDDLAVGTSSRSSKLIHGGLRYLEHLHFGLVREALAERELLARLAPHLVTLRRFLVPVTGGRWQLPYIAAGLSLYDLLGGRRGGRFEALGVKELTRRLPQLDASVVVGGFEYTDGVCDDARMVLAVAETSRREGGEIFTHAEVTGAEPVGNGWEVEVTDRFSGKRWTLKSRAVIDVTGAFGAADPGGGGEASVTASRGVHLVVDGARLTGNRGMTVRVPGRVVFLIPWGRRWLIGTTDVAHHGPIDRPTATAAEVDYLLETINTVLSDDLTRHDLIATFAGIRPLAGTAVGDTSDLSREHRITADGKGFITVRGGKYTTYRRIAAEAVDRAAEHLGVPAPSLTDRLPLVGASTPAVLERTVGELAGDGLDPLEARWLVGRHGLGARKVLDAGREAGVAGRLHPDMPYLAAEAWWAVHRESAMTIDDVLARRTRLAIETVDHGLAAAPLVAELLAPLRGWSGAERDGAIAEYATAAEREYGVP